MPDIFETYDNIENVLSLLTYQPNDGKKAQAVARLKGWLMETELEINQFETTQWEQHMEELADEHYQMKLLEGGWVKW